MALENKHKVVYDINQINLKKLFPPFGGNVSSVLNVLMLLVGYRTVACNEIAEHRSFVRDRTAPRNIFIALQFSDVQFLHCR